jgi:hypothetical protein
MAYCRFGDDSDVYLQKIPNEGWECCRCALKSQLGESVSLSFYNIDAVFAHMKEHRTAGHKVPNEVFGKLFDEKGRM